MQSCILRQLWCAAFLLTLAATCAADSLDDGRALYKAGRYSEAVAKLEQATREKPGDAKAWWQLNFAYNKLGRYSDALRAVRKAAQVDPSHGFASEPGKYEEVLTRLESKAGASGSPTPASSSRRPSARTGAPPLTGGNRIVQQLMKGDVYVEPGMNVDAARLQRVANDLRPAVVKFAVFNSRSGSSTLSREADRIRSYMRAQFDRGRGYMIVASRGGVAVSTESLSRNRMRDLIREAAPRMEAGDYTGGLERLARALVRTQRAQAAGTRLTWTIILGVVVAGVVLIVILRRIGNARAMAARREPLERQKSDVIAGLNFLDDNIPLVDPDSGARVRQARVNAGTRLDEAAKQITRARSDRDLARAQSLLDQAQAEITNARGVLDRAMTGSPASPAPAGGVGASVGASAPAAAATVAPPVYPLADRATGAATDWIAVPETERGVCFFCSRPSRLSELTPVTVNLEDRPQKVLACPDDMETIRSGEMPRIRAFQQGGRYVPWYAYQDYDPYRDYYARGYSDRSLLSDLVMYSMIDHMFWDWHHPHGWGWGGGWGGPSYVFYPDHEYYRDHYSTEAAGYADFDRDTGSSDHATGTDFMQDTGGDTGGFTDAVGADFGSDQS